MSSNLEYLKELEDYLASAKSFADSTPDELEFKVDKIVNSYQSMFSRFFPHQIGDRVTLTKVPDFDKAPGWVGSKHFLVVGATATVVSRDYRKGLFTFDVLFDDDSWIDNDGITYKRKVGARNSFLFDETYLSNKLCN